MNDILHVLLTELRHAENKFPEWPTDLVHQCAIMQEECGEAMKEALDYEYDQGDKKETRERFIAEVIQTGAMAIRILKNIPLDTLPHI